MFLEGLKDSIGALLQEESSQGTQPLSYLRHGYHVASLNTSPYLNESQIYTKNKKNLVLPICFSRSPGAGLKGLFRFVESSVRQNGGRDDGESWGPPVLLIDDLSVLLSLGVTVGAILDFTLYCQATVCSELQVSQCFWVSA